MTKLSVNINKIATIRNARGGDTPSVVEAAINCQKFGADGITIHPRPDERHITKKDVYAIKPIITTEYNIEGYPSSDFIKMVIEVKPEQVTLVPDGPDVITSCAGWDTVKFQDYLKEIITEFKQHGIRTSIFVDPKIEMIEGAKICGTDRIELYTDSKYSIDCVEKWYKMWIQKNNLEKKNINIIKIIYDNIQNLRFEFKYIKAHTNLSDEHSMGNAKADQLATNSLKKY